MKIVKIMKLCEEISKISLRLKNLRLPVIVAIVILIDEIPSQQSNFDQIRQNDNTKKKRACAVCDQLIDSKAAFTHTNLCRNGIARSMSGA